MTNTVMQAMRLIEAFLALIVGRRLKVVWGGPESGHVTDHDFAVHLPRPTVGDAAEVALLTRLAVHEAGHVLFTEPGWSDRLQAGELQLFNALEDPRIEFAHTAALPGAGLILQRGLDEMLAPISEGLDVLLQQQNLGPALQMDVLIRGLLALTKYEAVERHAPAILEKAGRCITPEQRAAIDEAVAALKRANSSRDTEAIATGLWARLNATQDGADQEPGKADTAGSDQGSTPPQGEAGQDHDATERAADTARQESSGSDGSPGDPAADDPAGHGGADDPGEAERQDEQPTPSSQGAQAGEQPTVQGGEKLAEREGAQSGDLDSGQEARADRSTPTGSAGEQRAEPGDTGESTGAGAGSTQELAAAAAGDGQGCEPSADDGGQQPGALPAALNQPGADFGDLVRAVLADRYGGRDADTAPSTAEAEQLSDEDVGRVRQLLEQEPPAGGLEELLEQAMSVLAQSSEQASTPELGTGAGLSLGGAPPAHGPDRAFDSCLQGVQARMVTILARELQDRRRRPTKPATTGVRVMGHRFWRMRELGDTKVFAARKLMSGIDAAAVVLLDVSGSMEHRLATAVDATLAFSLALQRLNVRTKVAVFPGWYTVTEVLQSFGEPARTCVERAKHLEARGGTPTGAAVAIEMQELLQQRALRKFMVVVTDDGPGDYPVLQQTLTRAAELDIQVCGVGIGCDISGVFPASQYILGVEELPDALQRLFSTNMLTKLAA